MLITERTSDGRTIVRLHKDWHPGRISAGYLPPQRNYMEAEEDFFVQHTLLKGTSIIGRNRNLTKIGATL
jgi:hypothetical protein